VRAWLRVLQPSLMVLVESEFWPRHLAECERAGVPVAVVNARVSDRSFPRYMRLKRLWKPFLAKVRLFLAQGEESADRLRQIGAPVERVRVSGNLKYDVPVAVASPLLDLLREHLPQPNKPIVCGSTHDGEEAQILDQWTRLLGGGWTDTVLVLAPRHPERFPAVAALIAERGLPLIRASEFLEDPAAIPPRSVFLLDTLGSLAATYALAKVAFIGGSLVPKGGHNPLEAARFGVPIVMGPHYDNFREIVDGMMAAQAIFIMPAMLTSTLHFALVAGGPTGERGRAYFQQQGGATGKSVEALLTLMGVPQRLEPEAVVDCNGTAEAGPLSKAEDAR
jgi:3-deoxy-D-manno-octulosonic-acid transferase